MKRLTFVVVLLSRRRLDRWSVCSEQPSFRAGVDIVSLNVTVTDAANHYVTDLEEGGFPRLRRRRQAERHVLHAAPAAHRPVAAARQQRQHGGAPARSLQTAATNFVQRLKPNDIAQVIDFDSRVEIRQGFTGNQAELDAAISQLAAGGSTSLHNAIYIALKELRKVRAVNEEDVRRQALIVFSDGEDTSSLVSFDEVLDLAKRSETAIYTIALRGSDAQAKGFREAEFVMRTLAQETGGRSFFPAKIDDLNGVYTQIADELASQYTLGYTSTNPASRRRLAADRRAGIAPERHPADEEGLLRPDGPLNLLPLLLYAAAVVVYAIHFAKRQPVRRPRGHDAAPAGRPGPYLRHRHADDGSAARAVREYVHRRLDRSSGCWRCRTSISRSPPTSARWACSSCRSSSACRRSRASIPAWTIAIPVLDSPWFWVHVASLLFAYASFALAGDARADLRAAVQGDQEEAPRLLLHAAAVAADARRDELARGRRRLAVPDDRRRRRHRLDGAGAGPVSRQLESAGDVAARSEDLHRRADVGGVFVRGVRAARRWDGRAGGRRGCRRWAS